MTTVNTPPKTVQTGFKKQFDALAEQAKAKKAPSSSSAQGPASAGAKAPAQPGGNAKGAEAVDLNRDRFEPAGTAKSQTAQGALLVQPASPAGSGGAVQGVVGEQLRAALDAARLAGGAGAKNVKTPDVKPK